MKRDAIWQSIEEGRKDHTCLPFWSWNDRLEPEEIRRQIEAMRKAGIGGYFMHARGGLERGMDGGHPRGTGCRRRDGGLGL